MLNKIIMHYSLMQIESKSAFWYTVSNIVQKSAPWLVMFILTHNLSMQEYGLYAVYLAWQQIIEIIISIRVYGNIFVAKLFDSNIYKDNYTNSVQTLVIFSALFWLFILLLFKNHIVNYLEVPFFVLLCLVVNSLSTTFYEIWNARQRVDNNYIDIVKASFVYSTVGPVLGALMVYCNFDRPVEYIIGVRVFIQFLVSIHFGLKNFSEKYIISFKCIKEIFLYNIPLIPYYFSTIIFNNVDRILIQKFSSLEDTAIYSVAKSLSMVIFVFSGALNLTLQTWLYKNLKNRSLNNDKLLLKSAYCVSCVCIFFVIVTPEIISSFCGDKYIATIDIIIPLVLGVYLMFVYQQYINLILFYGFSKLIMYITSIIAILNIVFNLILIPLYSYRVSAYIVLATSLLIVLVTFYFANGLCKSNKIMIELIFYPQKQVYIFLTMFLVTMFISFFNYHYLVRGFVFCCLVGCLIFERKQGWISKFNS